MKSNRAWRLAAWNVGLAFAMAAVPSWAAPPDVGHLETPDDAPAKRADRAVGVTPRGVVTLGPYRSVQVNVNAAGDNVAGDAANEPSIAVDPNDANRIAIGWRQFDSVTSNFRQAGRAYTTDGGYTWTFPGVLEPGIFRSDPVLDYDADGVFYYNSLRSDFTCQYFISGDGGQTFSQPFAAYGGDKQWSAIDRTNGIGRGNIYVAWSPAAGCCGNRLFTRSTNGGTSFMYPIVLPASPMWGTLAVAPNGNLFVCSQAANGFANVMRSTNAKFAGVTPSFPLVRSVDLGGNTRFSTNPNPGGLLGQVWIACEPQGGPRPDNVYLLGSVDPPGSDPLDVMFTRSTDGGNTWEAPRRINDDPVGNDAVQWFGAMSVAPNGRIDAVWNDTRANPGIYFSQLYYTYSLDGGVTWAPNVAVSPSFNPLIGFPNQNKIGDYSQIISHNASVHVAYAATYTGGQDVYYLRIPIDCNENGVDDADDIAAGTSLDCDSNGVPDECDRDCDNSGVVDACEVAAGSAPDCDHNGVPDSCDRDCDGSGGVDACEVAAGSTPDCDHNGNPDACDIASGLLADCDGSGVPDVCEVATGARPDCNANGIPDACDIAAGRESDCDANGVPDVCDRVVLRRSITPPTAALSCIGGQVQFSVSAAGATGYQWKYAGMDIPGATAAQLSVDPVQAADEGPYSCVVSFGCLQVESPSAALQIAPDTLQVELVSADFLQTCTQTGMTAVALVVSVDDADGVTYQWQHDGQALHDGGRVSGATTATLNIMDLEPEDGGIYTCRVWNICIDEQDAVGVSTELEVIDPQFSSIPQHACVEPGGTATFTGAAASSSAASLVYRWYEGDTALIDGGRISGAATPTLHLSDATLADTGRRFRLRAVVPDPVCSVFSPEALVLVQPAGGCTECPAPGDLDADGDYDLMDAQAFLLCFGADVAVRPECRCANVQADNPVIDIADWALLESILAGPH
ncbi:MAG TPA: hypothetical protein P5572_07470 [Phycisphaerae bacterium]|nr:hypothetical protein [Phycisphaerales bacterium]HRX84841.1 hypothetical protein [Phycisphaerae bacterium]